MNVYVGYSGTTKTVRKLNSAGTEIQSIYGSNGNHATVDPLNGVKHDDGRLYTKEELEQIGKLIDYNGDTNKTLYYNSVTNTCFAEDITVSLDDVKTS